MYFKVNYPFNFLYIIIIIQNLQEFELKTCTIKTVNCEKLDNIIQNSTSEQHK